MYDISKNLSNSFYKYDSNINQYSSYLVISILSDFLDKGSVIKSNIESFYNSQMLAYLKYKKLLIDFPLKDLVPVWTNINKAIDLLFKEIEQSESVLTSYQIYWSNDKFNFTYKVPLVTIKKDSIDLFLILQNSFKDEPLTFKEYDILKIPSVLRIINYFKKQSLSINNIKVLWIDSSNLKTNFKLIKYPFNDRSIFRDSDDILNFKNNPTNGYNNLLLCPYCPYKNSCMNTEEFYTKSVEEPFKHKDIIITKEIQLP